MSTSSSESNCLTALRPRRPPFLFSRALPIAIAALSWFALCAQINPLFARVSTQGTSLMDGLSRLYGYLTNQTILLSAISFSALIIKRPHLFTRFFHRPAVTSAIVAYLVFVGVTYNVLLRQLWHPTGFQAIVNETLHSVVPLMSLTYWIFFVPFFNASLKTCLLWLIYPAAYLLYTLWHGSHSGLYPYPFLNAGILGYPRVLLNVAGLIAGFLTVMALLLMINQSGKRRLKAC